MTRLAAIFGVIWFGIVAAMPGHAADAVTEPFQPDSPFAVPIEIRLGVLYHEDSRFQRAFGDSDKSRDGGPIDVTGEVLVDPYSGSFSNPIAGLFLTPSFRLGGTINTGGGISHFNAGLAFDQDFPFGLFAEGAIGLAIHNGTHDNEAGGSRPLGCNPVGFMALSAGVKVADRWRLMATVEHLDNFELCRENGQLTNIGLRIGYRFN